MTLRLLSLPRDLQARVVKQRHFVQALRLALTGRDRATIVEQARELHVIAANGLAAAGDARARTDNSEAQDIARTAAVQALAAATGATLLDEAAHALACGDEHRLAFIAATKQAFGMAPSTQARADSRDLDAV